MSASSSSSSADHSVAPLETALVSDGFWDHWHGPVYAPTKRCAHGDVMEGCDVMETDDFWIRGADGNAVLHTASRNRKKKKKTDTGFYARGAVGVWRTGVILITKTGEPTNHPWTQLNKRGSAVMMAEANAITVLAQEAASREARAAAMLGGAGAMAGCVRWREADFGSWMRKWEQRCFIHFMDPVLRMSHFQVHFSTPWQASHAQRSLELAVSEARQFLVRRRAARLAEILEAVPPLPVELGAIARDYANSAREAGRFPMEKTFQTMRFFRLEDRSEHRSAAAAWEGSTMGSGSLDFSAAQLAVADLELEQARTREKTG